MELRNGRFLAFVTFSNEAVEIGKVCTEAFREASSYTVILSVRNYWNSVIKQYNVQGFSTFAPCSSILIVSKLYLFTNRCTRELS